MRHVQPQYRHAFTQQQCVSCCSSTADTWRGWCVVLQDLVWSRHQLEELAERRFRAAQVRHMVPPPAPSALVAHMPVPAPLLSVIGLATATAPSKHTLPLLPSPIGVVLGRPLPPATHTS